MMTPTTPPPPKEALAYLRAKGYKIAWDYRDLSKEEHVRAFTVAKAMTQELLMEIRQAVDAALAEGKTFKQFQDELEPLLGKRGWLGKVLMEDGAMVELGTPRRLKIIYDTHMRTARAAGQWVRIERNKAALPYLRYGLGPSREHRLQHVQWEGLILPVDAPFWDTHLPPNGWGCRCRVRQMTERQASQRGGVSEAPEQKTTLWENRRTGKVEEVPVGIDPGWNVHPGKARLSHTQTLGKEKDIEFRSIVGTIR
ncbi:phage minor head protein [Candidatus Williamhamiltonella defendens]|uniref:phage head morphogenesis protein n=1 Tax=Candidatus Williamhamiltonella defendens TaxID=138072 RepID=UPI0020C69A84|nr:phage minor head protein [Candidatus Hamiltonella defensa]